MGPVRNPVLPLRRKREAAPYKPTPADFRRQLEAAVAAYDASMSRIDAYKAIVAHAEKRHGELAYDLALAEQRYKESIEPDDRGA